MSHLITGLGIGAAAGWLGAAALALAAGRAAGLRLTSWLSAAAGVAAVACGALSALHGAGSPLQLGSTTVGAASFQVTPLASVFIALLGAIAAANGLYAPRYHHPDTGVVPYLIAYNLALLASLAVLAAAGAVAFLVAWESMALTSYLLILRNHRQAGVGHGGFLFVALSEAGFVLIVLAFAILAVNTGSLEFTVMIQHASRVPLGWRTAAFLLALVGFGFKAGLVPLHIWLPAAHPVAPADGSAFLSGLVVKLGVYGIALFGVVLLAGGPARWGLVTMGAGAISAVLGILYALMERDVKRFLAFSTIENVGVILTALGASMTFTAYGHRAIGVLLLIVALYHSLNHGIYKTLLFQVAGVIEHATGTRDLDRLGGLIKRMPRIAVIFLVGVVAIAALPPLNGFVSEWLLFEGLFQGFRISDNTVGILIVVAGAGIALTGGLAINAFARAFGISCLGMPRSRQAANATEAGQPLAGPGALAAACAFLGVGAPLVLTALDRVAHAVTGTNIQSKLIVPKLGVIPAHTSFAEFSPTYLTVFLIAVTLIPLAIYFAGRPRARSRRTPVWDGGIVSFKARMQYTATTHANPVRVTFDPLYQPRFHVERRSDDPAGRSGPVHYRFTITPIFDRYLYQPLLALVKAIANRLRPLQNGDVNLYIFYVFVVVVLAYALYT